jgi:hypothetical protein
MFYLHIYLSLINLIKKYSDEVSVNTIITQLCLIRCRVGYPVVELASRVAGRWRRWQPKQDRLPFIGLDRGGNRRAMAARDAPFDY